jgi:hypothetical protein
VYSFNNETCTSSIQGKEEYKEYKGSFNMHVVLDDYFGANYCKFSVN